MDPPVQRIRAKMQASDSTVLNSLLNVMRVEEPDAATTTHMRPAPPGKIAEATD